MHILSNIKHIMMIRVRSQLRIPICFLQCTFQVGVNDEENAFLPAMVVETQLCCPCSVVWSRRRLVFHSPRWISNFYFSARTEVVKASEKNRAFIIIIIIIIRCTTLLPPFFSEIRGFIVKNWLYTFMIQSPSLATTFSHLSGSVRIPRRKN